MIKNKICGVYSIYCIENKKVYVGSTRNYKQRATFHKKKMKGGYHSNQHLQNAWNLYGKENFVFSILEVCKKEISRGDLELLEKKWILQYNSHKKEFGFNKCLSGTIPLKEVDENQTSMKRGDDKKKAVVMIDILTKEIQEFPSYSEAARSINIRPGKIADLVLYWDRKFRKRSLRNKIYVRKSDFKPYFDYIGTKF